MSTTPHAATLNRREPALTLTRVKRLLLALLLSPVAFSASPQVDGGIVRGRRARTIADVKLLYFHASWCASCARLESGGVLERIGAHAPALAIVRIDVDAQASLLDRYGVTQTPTLLLVDAEGFPLGKVAIDLAEPDVTLERVQKLLKKMVKP